MRNIVAEAENGATVFGVQCTDGSEYRHMLFRRAAYGRIGLKDQKWGIVAGTGGRAYDGYRQSLAEKEAVHEGEI